MYVSPFPSLRTPDRAMEILGASSAAEIESEEFGDGNLNLVFRCK